jgi:predicted site-specific integrase-resolvase
VDSPVIARIALYARVSTLNGQNPEMQLAELREYAQRRGWVISGEYTDLGISGSKDSRPQLNRMLEDAHARKFDAIAVWKLDRLGRSLKHLVTTIEDLQAYSVSFVSLRDNLDLSTPAGRLMMHIIGAMAEFERSLIQERVVAGEELEEIGRKHEIAHLVVRIWSPSADVDETILIRSTDVDRLEMLEGAISNGGVPFGIITHKPDGDHSWHFPPEKLAILADQEVFSAADKGAVESPPVLPFWLRQ